MLTIQEAMETQYRLHSYYTVWAVDTQGNRHYIGYTARHSGTGLLNMFNLEECREALKAALPVDEQGTCLVKKTRNTLELANGWKVTFGGTIRQEATEAKYATQK